MNKNNAIVWLLNIESGEYDAYQKDVVGAVTDEQKANAWLEQNRCNDPFMPGVSYTVDMVTLNVLDKAHLEKINRWLDPKTNPMCECGHRLLHHTKGGRCRHNQTWKPKHKCKKFRRVS